MVRVGIIGCGHISKKHLETIMEIDNVELVGAVDCDFGKAELVVHQYGGTAYLDYREMIEKEIVRCTYMYTALFA